MLLNECEYTSTTTSTEACPTRSVWPNPSQEGLWFLTLSSQQLLLQVATRYMGGGYCESRKVHGCYWKRSNRCYLLSDRCCYGSSAPARFYRDQLPEKPSFLNDTLVVDLRKPSERDGATVTWNMDHQWRYGSGKRGLRRSRGRLAVCKRPFCFYVVYFTMKAE